MLTTTAGEGGAQQSLKFWDATRLGAAASSGGSPPPLYTLNTRADTPHLGAVSGLAFHPREAMVATTSEDGEFKLWARSGGSSSADSMRTPRRWRCRSVGSYKRRPFGGVAFSGDGSLLAVGAGAAATLWDPFTNTLAAVLPAPSSSSGGACGARIVQLAFSSCSPHLAGLLAWPTEAARDSEETLVVWDLLTLSVAWSAAVPNAVALTADPSQPQFVVTCNHSVTKQQHIQQQQQHAAAGVDASSSEAEAAAAAALTKAEARRAARAARRGCALVFSPLGPAPIFAAALPPGSAAAAALYVPPGTALGVATAAGYQTGSSSSDPTPLLLVTEDRHYTVVAPLSVLAAASASVPETAATAAASALVERESALEAVFGKTAATLPGSEAAAFASSGDARAAAKRAAMLFDAPSHALPPPSQLCPSLLELLLGQGS